MQLKETSVTPCVLHKYYHYVPSCLPCVSATLVNLCSKIDTQIDNAIPAKDPVLHDLHEVFNGTMIAQFSDTHTTTIVALPQTEEDIQNETIRYTIELRKKD